MRPFPKTKPSLLFLSLVIISCQGNLPPNCHYDQFNSQSQAVGQVRCGCRQSAPSYNIHDPSSPTHSFPLSPSYSGNLNFLKEPLSRAPDLDHNIEVIIRDCHQIQLHLNFNMLQKYKINLRIIDSNKTEIVGVTLRDSKDGNELQKQSIMFKNIPELVKIGGRVETNHGGKLELKAENIGNIVIEGLQSDGPLKLTAKHLSTITIQNSQIHQLPWPGFFFFNVSRILITGNHLKSVLPRSVHITDVGDLNISHNIFPNLSQALNVDNFNTKTIQCNRENSWSEILPGCFIPPTVIPRGTGPTIPRVLVTRVTGDSDDLVSSITVDANLSLVNATSKSNQSEDESGSVESSGLLHTILSVSDMYGLVFIGLSVVLVLVFLAVYWCCYCRRNKPNNQAKEDNDFKMKTPVLGNYQGKNPFLDPHLGCEEDDEYSNSSKSHLAQAGDSITDPFRSPFITVSSVKTEKGKGGVVCGSLTLGPSFPVKESNVRSVVNNQLKHQTFSKV